jgi:FkbM family methyltransferase
MLLDWNTIAAKYDLANKVTGVIHCGARIGEEADYYQSAGIDNVWWVEANDNILVTLAQNVVHRGHKVIHALVWDEDEVEFNFNVTNLDGMSSSILSFGTHVQFSPEITVVETKPMKTRRIDTLVDMFDITNVNMLVLDIQGVEAHALRGAARLLPSLQFVMSEVNDQPVYIDCDQVWELDGILKDFDRVETCWVPGQGWGDALYARKNNAG